MAKARAVTKIRNGFLKQAALVNEKAGIRATQEAGPDLLCLPEMA